MKQEIICIGSVEAELVFTSRVPDPKSIIPRLRRTVASQTRIDAQESVFGIAGGAYLAAVACSRLGITTSIRAQVGNDSLGSEALRRLKEEGVDTHFMIQSSLFATSVTSVVRTQKDEHLDIVYTGKSQEYDKKTFIPSHYPNSHSSGWLYITDINRNLTILKQLLDWAKRSALSVAIQVTIADIPQSRRGLQLLARADVILMEREDAEFLTHQTDQDAALRALRMSGLKTVVIHDGLQSASAIHDGFIYATQRFGSARSVSSLGVDSAYNASFLASFIVGREFEDSLSFGLVAARSVGTYVGSDAGLLRSFAHRAGKVTKKFL